MNGRLTEDVEVLFDYAEAHPDGFDIHDVEDDLDWRREHLYAVGRALRLVFADDEINLICEPNGYNKPWLYKLVGTYDDARVWATVRYRDMYSRLETTEAVATSLVNATDGRSIEGRKVRKIARTLSYLRAELVDIEAGV
jgi:hypothetical protein